MRSDGDRRSDLGAAVSGRIESANGLFSVHIDPSVQHSALREFVEWKIGVSDADGQPVTDASIFVGGGMPAHGHGLPTQPRISANHGDGDYTVSGLKFNMAGEWLLRFDIQAGDKFDGATLQFKLAN